MESEIWRMALELPSAIGDLKRCEMRKVTCSRKEWEVFWGGIVPFVSHRYMERKGLEVLAE